MGDIDDSRGRHMRAVRAMRVPGRQVVRHGAVRQEAGHVDVQWRCELAARSAPVIGHVGGRVAP